MIQKLTPLTKGSTAYQCKDFYYDGVRRITETIFRPELSFVMIDPSMVEEGSNGLEYVFVEKEQNDEAAKLSPEENEESTPGGGGGVEEPIELIEMGQPEGEVWTDREYIYGTDYVDEFVAQVDRDETLIYLHQDANYNVVALTAGMAADPTIFLPPAGTLMSQYTWDPYGTLAAEDRAHIHAVNRIGHQGLFFERLDGGNDTPPLATNARGFYYNRNRLYSPSLGRFMQRDPNETGTVLLAAAISNGNSFSTLFGGFDARRLFTDGANLYAYQRNNPVTGSDPLGLEDDFGDTMIDVFGERAAFADRMMDAAGQAFEYRKYIGNFALALVPGGGAIAPLMKLALGEIDMVSALGEIGLGIAGGAAFAWAAKAGPGLLRATQGMIGRLYGRMKSMASKYRRVFRRTAQGRACFVAGTLVLMADGSYLPIEKIQLSDKVASLVDPCNLGMSEELDSNWDESLYVIYLRVKKTAYSVTDAQLVRPESWINLMSLEQGCTLQLKIPELGLDGSAEVVFVKQIPSQNRHDPVAGSITGLFVTSNEKAIDLSIYGLDVPIGTTPSHPFWSVSHNGWVKAGDLLVGDSVWTSDGSTATVVRSTLRDDVETVYNLEVFEDHTYFVTAKQLWVHNGCGPFPKWRPKFEQEEWIHKRAAEFAAEGWNKSATLRKMARDGIEGQILEQGGDPIKFAQLLTRLFGE